MADFKSFLAIGLQAAIDADLRRAEVRQVLSELDAQVFEATKGAVNISVGTWDPSGLNNLLQTFSTAEVTTPQAIIATGVHSNQKEKLATWAQSRDGYPCKITLGSDVYSCEDKQALENCLGELLQDPNVGGKIHKLMHPSDGIQITRTRK